MNNIFDSIDPIAWFTTTNGVIASLKPVIVLILGILIAFFVIDFIISIFKPKTNLMKGSKRQEYTDYDDDDDDGFPY